MWWFYHDATILHLHLRVQTAASARTYTTAHLCELLRSSQDIREGVQSVWIRWFVDGSHCPDSDLEAVGNALHHLEYFDHLHLFGWTDEKASVLLRHVPKRKIRSLRICSEDIAPYRFPSVMTELQRGIWLASLTSFFLSRFVLDERDCDSLVQFVRSRQQGKQLYMGFSFCTFPSMTGYLVVADALIESGPFDFHFSFNKVSDGIIPSNASSLITTKPHSDFYKRYEREDELYSDRFTNAARDHLRQYSDLNDAGRSTVLSKDNATSVQHWVDALCHDKVRNCVDYLYHFVSMNPNMYAAAARLQRAEGKTRSNDDKNNGGLAHERDSVAGRFKSRRRRQSSSSDDSNVGFASDVGSIAGCVKRRRRQEH